jgi:hypothetical protein
MIRAWITRPCVRSVSRRRARFPARPRGALAEHHVVAVQGLEPTVQYLQHRLRVVFVFRRAADQLAANSERLGKAAAVEIDRELRALGVGIGRVERRRSAECLGCLGEPAEPIQQVRPMQVVLRDVRGDRDGSVDRLERVGYPATQHLRCGQQTKRDLVL